jgi:hypothetical protein
MTNAREVMEDTPMTEYTDNESSAVGAWTEELIDLLDDLSGLLEQIMSCDWGDNWQDHAEKIIDCLAAIANLTLATEGLSPDTRKRLELIKSAELVEAAE